MNKYIYIIAVLSAVNMPVIAKEGSYTEAQEKEHSILVNEMTKTLEKKLLESENLPFLETIETKSEEENIFQLKDINDFTMRVFNNRGEKSNVMLADIKEMNEDSGNRFCYSETCYKKGFGFWDMTDTYYLFNEYYLYKISGINLKNEATAKNKNLKVSYFEKNDKNTYVKRFQTKNIYFNKNYNNFTFKYNGYIYNNILTPYTITNVENKIKKNKINEATFTDAENNVLEINNVINKLKYKDCEIYFENILEKKTDKYKTYNFPFSKQVLSYTNDSIKKCNSILNKKNKLIIYQTNEKNMQMIFDFDENIILSLFIKNKKVLK